MHLHPAKFSFEMESSLFGADTDHKIVDDLPRDLCEIYMETSGSPEDAIIRISELNIPHLKKELEKGEYSKHPDLENCVRAVLKYAEQNPSFDGWYCFVCEDY